MLYVIGWMGCLLLCLINLEMLFRNNKSWIEQIVVVNNMGIVLYLCFSVIFISIEQFAVWKILLCVALFNIVLLIIILCTKYKKNKICMQKPLCMEWVMIGTILIIFPLVKMTAEDIGTVSDQGSYFLHTLNLMEGNCSIVYNIPEYGAISDNVDRGIEKLQEDMTIFYHGEEENQYYIHALNTWCSILALFGKMFGLWKCMKACNYIYFLTVANIFYLCRIINRSRYGGLISLFMFALSPLILYIAKAGLTEVVLVYLFVLGLKLIFEKKYYLAGICVGMIGFMHISMYVYMPIITVLAFLESLKTSHREIAFFNVIQVSLFYLSIRYAHMISPVYVERELGRLSVGKLPYKTLIILITVIVVWCIVIQLYTYFNYKNMLETFYHKIYGNFRIISLCILGVCVCCSLYYAYCLCYTDKYAVSYDALNTWSMRSEYVNSGIRAISHLNIINIGRATGIVGIITALFFLVKKDEKNEIIKCLYFLELYGLFVYTVIRIDVPFNYYASRYFIPFVIPLISLILESLALRTNWLFYVIMITVLYNRHFWPSFTCGAPFVGQFDILKDSLDIIPYKSAVVCSSESTYTNTRLTSNLRLLNKNRVYNFENLNEIILSENEIYAISDKKLDDLDLIFSKIYDVQWSFGHGDNGRYSTKVGTHEISVYIYLVK